MVAYASERLLEAGALDVFTTPVHMKKGRTGHLMTVLGRPGALHELAAVILRETTTLGLRWHREGRIELQRSTVGVRTAYGTVHVKVGSLNEEATQAWPEYEDCAALARRHRVPLKEVQWAALAAYRRRTGRTRSPRDRKRGNPR